MKHTVVLTGVGRDRVGIVAELAQLLFELGCNLLDSSMTLLRGEFALILMAELPDGVTHAQLRTSLQSLEKQLGMQVHAREITDEQLNEEPKEQNSFIVSVYGADKPGIVAKVTRALADASLNITDVQTKSTGGTNKIFIMILEVTSASDVSSSFIQELPRLQDRVLRRATLLMLLRPPLKRSMPPSRML